MSEPIVSFVMSGGVGSRLWPLSREDNPKQFHNLSGDGSMLAKTVARLKARPGRPDDPVWLIASARHIERVNAEVEPRSLTGGRVIYEPVGRNTAAAVAAATLATLGVNEGGLALVVPSDHEIATDTQFWTSIEAGIPAARAGDIVVFGIAPDKPETGFGYIEIPGDADRRLPTRITRFVEKPDLATAEQYLKAGNFFWNAGIFLFSARAMRAYFLQHAPDIWNDVEKAWRGAADDVAGIHIRQDDYAAVRSTSVDYAIVEHVREITMVPATFRWSDLGSWQSLLETSRADARGNVVQGDVIAIDCDNTYLRSEGRLLSVIGLRNIAVVSTADATFVAPVSESQNVKKIVEQLEKSGRLETRFTPAHDRLPVAGAWRDRIHHWLFDETLPLWSTVGVDRDNGGFHETLSFDGVPVHGVRRMRTMARQIYAFAVAKQRGWSGPADGLIAHGIDFIETRGRASEGGWVKAFNADGSVADDMRDAYDHAFILLALAHAHKTGHPRARALATETLAFIDAELYDHKHGGYRESVGALGFRRSNPHMHMLEAYIAWHEATGEELYLERAARIIDLFRDHFFDADSWTLGEYFNRDWSRAPGEKGQWTEPGHHFEWAALLVAFEKMSGERLAPYARKLYACAISNGLNRSTGLAYDAVSRDGVPLARTSRSWPQTEAIKAAIALDGTGGPDMAPEVEARVGRLFRWHIEGAPKGLWIDLIDEKGVARAKSVPASIFYHLVCALTQYLDSVGDGA